MCSNGNKSILIARCYISLMDVAQYLIFVTSCYVNVKLFPNGHTTSNRRGFDVDTTSIRRRPNFDEFHVISAYSFDVISLVEKSMWFPRTFFDVISLVKKSTWFPRTFFDVISMVEKSTLFPRTFFDVISMVEKSTLFRVLLSV